MEKNFDSKIFSSLFFSSFKLSSTFDAKLEILKNQIDELMSEKCERNFSSEIGSIFHEIDSWRKLMSSRRLFVCERRFLCNLMTLQEMYVGFVSFHSSKVLLSLMLKIDDAIYRSSTETGFDQRLVQSFESVKFRETLFECRCVSIFQRDHHRRTTVGRRMRRCDEIRKNRSRFLGENSNSNNLFNQTRSSSRDRNRVDHK